MNYLQAISYLDRLGEHELTQLTLTRQVHEHNGMFYAMLMPKMRSYPQNESTKSRMPIFCEIANAPYFAADNRDAAYIGLAFKMAKVSITNRKEYTQWAFDLVCGKYDSPPAGFAVVKEAKIRHDDTPLTVADVYFDGIPGEGDYKDVIITVMNSCPGLQDEGKHMAVMFDRAVALQCDSHFLNNLHYDQGDVSKKLLALKKFPLAVGDTPKQALVALEGKMGPVLFDRAWLTAMQAVTDSVADSESISSELTKFFE